MDHIILIGFMGAGKTAVGKRLARQMQLPFVDTDDWIEAQEGRSISDIFAEDGEAYFRTLETDALHRLLDSKERCVISVGGGLPVQPQNWPISGGGYRNTAGEAEVRYEASQTAGRRSERKDRNIDGAAKRNL